MRTYIKDIKNKIGEEIKIKGFVQTIRDQSKIKFLIIRDISGIIQAVLLSENSEAFKISDGLTNESVVEIIGKVKEEKQAPEGVEIEIKEIKILSLADPNLPIPVVEKTGGEVDVNKRFDWRWIDLRKKDKLMMMKIWTEMERFFRKFWEENKYLEIHSPKLMGSPSESGANVFEVKYFDRKAYLAQSPQFYKQMAMASGLEKVFEVGPVFRAEPSFTTRHSTEFVGYDAEISYIESHQDVIGEIERMINFVLSGIKDKFGGEIRDMFGQEVVVPKIPFPQLTMADAKKILSDLGVPSQDNDLSPEEERAICDYIKEKEGHEFVFITEYPTDIRPFYHMRKEDNPNITKSSDLLWKGVEIITLAQREHRYDVLVNQAKEKGLGNSVDFYTNFFKYGCPPHGGFGLGASRFLMKMLDLPSIREATYLFRGVNRLEP